MRTIVILSFLASAALAGEEEPFSVRPWTPIHCDLATPQRGAVRATFWKGYEATGIETTRLPLTDWSRFLSFRFDVENPYREPVSVYVRVSNRADHPAAETYTGGTFDGFVIGPGRSTVEISLVKMRSPEDRPVDPRRIAYLGVFFQPLFLRDGMELKFRADATFVLSNLRLSERSAAEQKQPYGDLLFPPGAARPADLERALDDLRKTIEQAKARGIETRYAEIYPFLATLAFQSRLVAFWQDRGQEQRRALDFLLAGSRQANRELLEALESNDRRRRVPPIPEYGRLSIRDGYFRLGDEPVLLFGMLYNQRGPLLNWFANSQTDSGTQLVAGGTRHDVEKQPIWAAYQKYPDTHRVGWAHSDHIIRDSGSWEVLGPPVNVCLESPHSREAVARMIENYERGHAGVGRNQLVQNMGFEYTYACYCDYTKRMWADWLRRKHSDVSAANRIWGTRLESFDRVPMPRPETAGSNRALWFDWSSFNLHRFLEQIRWTRDQIRRWDRESPLTVGSPYFAFDPAFWTAVDEEELADSDITGVVLEENYELDTLMPEYLHALAGGKPVADFEYHGVIHQILPSFLHGDAAISMWWWNERKHWTPNEPINEWASSFPQSYTIPLSDVAKAMRDALDLRRLSRETAALASAPRPIALLYSKTSMLQHLPDESRETGTFPYLAELRRVYNASQSTGLYVGLTTEKKILAGDLRQRKVLVVPSAEYVAGGVPEEILRWVESGGTAVVSPDSLLADEYARPASVLESLGLRLVGREPPALKRGEKVVTEYNLPDLPRVPLTIGGAVFEAAGGRQILECGPANVVARFPDGRPALVRAARGRGVVYWLAAPLEPASWGRFLSRVAGEAGLKPELQVRPPVEYRVTTLEGRRLAYLYNDSDEDRALELEPAFAFTAIVDRRSESTLPANRLRLPARETAILEFR
jgi:beta-galactosidase